MNCICIKERVYSPIIRMFSSAQDPIAVLTDVIVIPCLVQFSVLRFYIENITVVVFLRLDFAFK